MWTKKFKTLEIAAVIGCIMLVGAPTHCALFHVLFESALNNVKCSLKFKLDNNATDETKNISYVKGEDTVDHNSYKMVEEILLKS